nr:hypothetical protein [uncultured bacterium]
MPAISTEGTIPIRLGKLTAKEFEGCVLALHNPGGQSTAALVYDLKRESDQASWQAVASRKGTPTPVGKFYIDDDNLSFRWLPGVTRAVAAGLCNCLLEVTSGSESRLVGLRVHVRETASVLDLRKDLTTINVAVADLPEDGTLHFELTELAGYGKVLQYDPPTKRVSFKQPLKLVLKKADKDSPGIELHMMLMKNASKVNLNVRPLMVAEKGATLPFTTKRLVDVGNGLNNELAAANNAKAADEKQVTRVEENLLSLSVVVGTAQEIALARQRRAELQRQLAALEAEIKVLEANIAAIDRRIKALPALGELGNALHDKASLNFRVYYLVGNKRVDLFSVDPKKSP